MVFYPSAWIPPLPAIPENVPVCEFLFDERYGRSAYSHSLDAYTCALTGRSITASQQRDDVYNLARGLSSVTGWKVNSGSEYDKVAAIFAHNAVEVMTTSWAVHRLNGVSSPASAALSASELRHQLQACRATVLFTVMPLLPVALEAISGTKVSRDKVFLCESPQDSRIPEGMRSVATLIKEGIKQPQLDSIRWKSGQGSRQCAYLCFSSGTSGSPKGVVISHRNVIANIIQIATYEKPSRDPLGPEFHDIALGLLPQSHIYSLIVICHASTYRGDQVIILPKFSLPIYLQTIQKYKIKTLYIVPPVIIAMLQSKPMLDGVDLSSVTSIYTGAAPLGRETAEKIAVQYPMWKIRQAYGLTEIATCASSTPPSDVWLGSAGCLLPGFEAKVIDINGNEITKHNTAGELFLKSPSVALGYLANESATRETFVELPEGRFMRTGDEVEIRVSQQGFEHIWVVDRIKELIKVKGHQVAPAELEAFLLTHPAVADAAVISIPDERAGELPKAFLVLSASWKAKKGDQSLKQDIVNYVAKEKSRHKWLDGGVEFIDVIPRSVAGKILRRKLKDLDNDARKQIRGRM
ncbi:uncharacterized protein Z520_02700 [Fonsecaea multimorphosa CBS 102226]|uniref:AMP-dependent synthetase/ligase domain-containing protein n=1 Tax=Fonsecaea multimorphosa CBS 102226 TaxID=1442371 RepID=A0A0D2K5Q6_9EURO|nr:uncharacterized protein Z520_02700 [Fonsecaea multimorphosa CBS 102226]KIY01148.1 hypothetical protein Z520_02700 [Fonsecaea multimorphosa CBS 102226]OAL28765.1 hypothetical protein AYO22_02630 [Fonsecaea multimorphosa]